MALTLICSITFSGTSPHGTYVSGDVLHLYFNDVSALVEPYLAGVLQTSGDFIDPNTNNDSSNTAYKSEFFTGASVCVGTNLATFTRVLYFPWLLVGYNYNSPACQVTPVVCDISFPGFPVIVNASTTASTDGSITVVATSTLSAVQYRLNQDFVYGDGNGSSSGVFSNLIAGTYQIYARDSYNCSAVLIVTVGADSLSSTASYGSHYILDFKETTDIISPVPRHRIEILERGYGGAQVPVKGYSDNPFVYSLRGEGSFDKFVTVMAAQATLDLLSETNFQFRALYTDDPEKYRVKWSASYDNGGSYQVLFIGPLVPDVYSEPYVLDTNYPVRITATDGFTLLKDIPFLGVGGARISGNVRSIQIVAQALAKLNLQMNIRVAINLYATAMASTDADDPLDQAYVDAEAYYVSGSAMSCLDVIQAIIGPYGARIIQWGNVWNIVRVEELKADYDYREFNYLGAYVSNATASPQANVAKSTVVGSLHWANGNQMIEIIPAYGKFITEYNLGLKENLIKNGNFRIKEIYNPALQQYSFGIDLTGFVFVTNGDAVAKAFVPVASILPQVLTAFTPPDKFIPPSDISNIALKFSGAGNAYLLAQAFSITMSFNDTMNFTFTYLIPTQFVEFIYQRVRIMVTYGAYWLKDDGTWSTVANTITIYETEFGKYKTYSIDAVPPIESPSDIQVKIYHSYAKSAEFTTLVDMRNKVTTTLQIGTRTEYNDGTNLHYYTLQSRTDAESVPTVIRPNDYNAISNAVEWGRVSYVPLANFFAQGKDFFIDEITMSYKPLGENPPKTDTVEVDGNIINGNFVLPQILKKSLFHSSFFGYVNSVGSFSAALFDNVYLNPQNVIVVTAAAYVFRNYLRDSSGVGFEKFVRDGVEENLYLHQILAYQLSGQYRTPSKKITGDMKGRIALTPLTTLVETMDNNTKYIPCALVLNVRPGVHHGEWMELKDTLSTGGGSNCNPVRGHDCGYDSGYG